MQAQSRRRSCSAQSAVTEQLESRRLFSVTVDNGFLIILGTDADDIITISLDADDSNLLVITDNDIPTFLDKRQLSFAVRASIVQGLDGNDELRIDESFGRISFGFALYGDAGD